VTSGYGKQKGDVIKFNADENKASAEKEMDKIIARVNASLTTLRTKTTDLFDA